MYDLNVVLPVSGTPERFYNRIQAFKKFGLLNPKSYTVQISILHGTQSIDGITKDWPYPVKLHPHEFDHPAPKIYYYYGTMTMRMANRARWHLKVDDDSITDVHGLISYLDDHYDYQTPHYLCAGYMNNLWPAYKQILNELGMTKVVFPKNIKFGHEWECCAISQAAMKQIINDKVAQNYLLMCSNIPRGWGDHAVAAASALALVRPKKLLKITYEPKIQRFSLFGGDLYHIHYVAPDKACWGKFMRHYANNEHMIPEIQKQPSLPEEINQQLLDDYSIDVRPKKKTNDKFYKKLRKFS